MRTTTAATMARGTDPDLIEVAEWRARFEVGRALSRGEAPGEVYDAIIGRFREELGVESYGEYADEVLMAALQRTVEAALSEGSTR